MIDRLTHDEALRRRIAVMDGHKLVNIGTAGWTRRGASRLAYLLELLPRRANGYIGAVVATDAVRRSAQELLTGAK